MPRSPPRGAFLCGANASGTRCPADTAGAACEWRRETDDPRGENPAAGAITSARIAATRVGTPIALCVAPVQFWKASEGDQIEDERWSVSHRRRTEFDFYTQRESKICFDSNLLVKFDHRGEIPQAVTRGPSPCSSPTMEERGSGKILEGPTIARGFGFIKPFDGGENIYFHVNGFDPAPGSRHTYPTKAGPSAP